MYKILLSSIAVALSIPTSHAYAWGNVGHRKVAEIAFQRLDPAVQAKVTEMLASGDDAPTTKCAYQTFEAAATWLDCVRGITDAEFSSYFHADRYQLCPELKLASKCKTGHCASDALNEAVATYLDKKAPLAKRRTALKVLIHLVGDLHQPLHVIQGADGSGARTVILEGHNTPVTLHEYWDEYVIAKLPTEQKTLDLFIEKFGQEMRPGTVTQWVEQNSVEAGPIAYAAPLRAVACDASKVAQTVTLDKAYMEAAAHYAYFKIAQAGVRLADIVNQGMKD